MNYEDLLAKAEKENLIVKEKNLLSSKGRINGNKIAIKKGLTSTEKTCILAEELGHHHTTFGNILDQSDSSNRKQEKVACKWAVNTLLTVEDLIHSAAKEGCVNLYEVANCLDITLDFLAMAIETLKKQYGAFYDNGTYTIIFNDMGFRVENDERI